MRSRRSSPDTSRTRGQQVRPVGRAEEDRALQAGTLARHLADHRPVVAGLEALRGHEQPQPGLPHDVGQLVRPVGRVDVDENRTDLGGGILDDHPLRAVGRPNPDPVADVDADAEQAAGHLVHRGVELAVGVAQPLLATDENLPVGKRGDRYFEIRPRSCRRAWAWSTCPSCRKATRRGWVRACPACGPPTADDGMLRLEPMAPSLARTRIERNGTRVRASQVKGPTTKHGNEEMLRAMRFAPRRSHKKELPAPVAAGDEGAAGNGAGGPCGLPCGRHAIGRAAERPTA